MRFVDSHCHRELRFSIGLETTSGRCYLAIPVSNRLVDYEEHYEILRVLHDGYPGTLDELEAFAARCRRRECDELLFMAPGSDRGTAV